MNNESIRYLRKKRERRNPELQYTTLYHRTRRRLRRCDSDDRYLMTRKYHRDDIILSLSLGPERGRGEGLHHVFDIKKLARHLSLYEVYSIWIDGRTDTYNRPLVGCILYAGTPLFGWGFRHFFLYISLPLVRYELWRGPAIILI